jgi:hypothetical protein
MFKVAFSNNKRAWCHCHLHKDVERPNLSITLTDDYYGHWKCWACNAQGVLSEEQMRELNLSKQKRTKPILINWSELVRKYCTDLIKIYPLFKYVLSRQWNVDPEIFYWFRMGFDGEAYTFPMKIDNNIVGIQRRFSDGSKCCVEDSQLGVFAPAVLNYENILFICEGLSDTIVVQDLFKEKWYMERQADVIGRPNCNYGKEIIRRWITDYWALTDYDEDDWLLLEDATIIIIQDNDEAGKKGALDLYGEIATNIECRCKIFKFDGAKDIREYITKFGKEMVKHELEEFINE